MRGVGQDLPSVTRRAADERGRLAAQDEAVVREHDRIVPADTPAASWKYWLIGTLSVPMSPSRRHAGR